jgi:hypothetical protein
MITEIDYCPLNGDRSQIPYCEFTERIRCPICRREQDATVDFYPMLNYASRIHCCECCEYTIIESEWEKVN